MPQSHEYQKALILPSKQGSFILSRTIPKPLHALPNELLVKVHDVALNPADQKIQTLGIMYAEDSKYPIILGLVIAGEVVDVGDKVFFASGVFENEYAV
ncbi:hypothetical protein D9758_012404 [Tetrapyrgos nigripes]|uniref:Alcohol dehydrogenase-like N-terminal domain-containing protein n=1 Tax=Tetrapyrgos nigripes TaxID=182062 RepID=A0A8H5D863_9AGAR|nr:hypothetical protein D9758_012404 [Tetrapyrgos nigripes]